MSAFKERDVDNLAAIMDCCDRIKAIYQRLEKSYEIFCSDADLRDAILMNIVQIGEASNRLSDECREKLSELSWNEIVGVRNIIVHGYVQISDELIWDIVTKDVPALKERVEKEV